MAGKVLDMQEGTGIVDGAGECRYVGQGAELVVDLHDGHESRVRAKGRLDEARRDRTAFVRLEAGDFAAVFGKPRGRIENRLVFDGRDDEVPASGPRREQNAFQGEIDRFRRPRGPEYLARSGRKEAGEVVTRLLDRIQRRMAEPVGDRRGIAENTVGGEKTRHDVRHLRCDRGRRRVVEIDTSGTRPSRQECTRARDWLPHGSCSPDRRV